jgi:hypothetical protein
MAYMLSVLFDLSLDKYSVMCFLIAVMWAETLKRLDLKFLTRVALRTVSKFNIVPIKKDEYIKYFIEYE